MVSSTSGMCMTSDARCAPCSQWWQLYSQLHRELSLPPWRWPALPQCPFPPNSAAARAWQPAPEPLALWQALTAARQAAAEQAEAARADKKPCPLSGKPDIEPTKPNDRV
jgi:hypothetical protein